MGAPALPLPGQTVALTVAHPTLQPFTRLVVLGGAKPAKDGRAQVAVAVLDGDGSEYVVAVADLTRVES